MHLSFGAFRLVVARMHLSLQVELLRYICYHEWLWMNVIFIVHISLARKNYLETMTNITEVSVVSPRIMSYRNSKHSVRRLLEHINFILKLNYSIRTEGKKNWNVKWLSYLFHWNNSLLIGKKFRLWSRRIVFEHFSGSTQRALSNAIRII